MRPPGPKVGEEVDKDGSADIINGVFLEILDQKAITYGMLPSSSFTSKAPIPYSEVLEHLQADLEAVEEALTTHLNSDVPLIPSIGHYLARGGGKRVRPILVLLSSKLCGYEGPRYIIHSCVVEFIHTATLLHDDVVDASEMRRGAPSANARWGNQASVLVGDYLFAKSLWLMASDNDARIIQTISDATVYLSEGEVLQLINEYNLASTEESYLDVIYRKTAALMAASCRIGATLGEASPVVEEKLEEYGSNVGYAFQLVDDALDYMSLAERIGKPVGQDLSDGNVTLPLIHLYRSAAEDEKQFIRQVFFESNGTPDGKLGHILELMEKHGAIDYTMARAQQFVDKAKAAICEIPDNVDPFYRNALLSLADFIVERDQ
jgi:octaprenyl-diphosphate synthase